MSRESKKTKSSFVLFLRFGFILLSVATVFGFLRYSLMTQAQNYVQDFSLQNSIDLSQGEVFPIARKLGAISKKEQFICILGTKGNIVFFEDKKASCESGLFQTKQETIDKIQDIRIQFTIRMPQEIVWGLFVFLAVQGLLVALILIGERKNVLEQVQNELTMAAVARQIGHDIRSPLAVLRFANDHKNSDSLRRAALFRLEELSTHLLKKEESHLHLARVEAVIQEICREKEAEFGSEIGISFTSLVPEQYFLPGDAFFWRRIFSNLINNAVEAKTTAAAKVEILVTANEKAVEVSIKDQGRGFSPDALSRIGEMNFTAGKKFGTGLGLSSAKKYVEQVGGSLVVDSILGQGSTIKISLPKLEQLVLIDDDEEFGELWRLWAEQKGIRFQFLHCRSRAEFSEKIETILPASIVFLDKNLDDAGDYRALAPAFQRKKVSQIYLCSGEGELDHDLPHWILGKVRKEPPVFEKDCTNC